MLLHSHDAEETQEHLLVGVVHGVPYCQIMEQTTVRLKDVVRTGTHLLTTTEHAPRPAIPLPQEMARD